MQEKIFGGNRVKQCFDYALGNQDKFTLSRGAFEYCYHNLKNKHLYIENHLSSYTILCLDGNIKATINNINYLLSKGDTLQIENYVSHIESLVDNSKFLVAGVKQSYLQNSMVSINLANSHKKVSKPWGHELWFNGEHPKYCLKEVMIKSGFRTSLQYHRFKEETNFLYDGHAKLVYKENSLVNNDEVHAKDLNATDLYSMSTIHVVPNILHRLEAITDLWLYEVSTPYLDDVIRVQDDKARQDGRIESEHIS